MAIRIAINGAAGRMGQRLVALAVADPELQIVSAIEHATHAKFGADAGTIAGVGAIGVPLTETLADSVDVIVDFSIPRATAAILLAALNKKTPLVVATTGLPAELEIELNNAAKQIPILWAPSMSLAVNLGMKLAETAARALADHPSGVDVEIIEQHHRFKEDAPSGTALKFGEIISGVMGQRDSRHGRSGRPGARPPGEIGYHAIRSGDNPGEHTIIFGMLGESLELKVHATSRDAYAHGALAAAKFLVRQKPAMYSMSDVLGL